MSRLKKLEDLAQEHAAAKRTAEQHRVIYNRSRDSLLSHPMIKDKILSEIEELSLEDRKKYIQSQLDAIMNSDYSDDHKSQVADLFNDLNKHLINNDAYKQQEKIVQARNLDYLREAPFIPKDYLAAVEKGFIKDYDASIHHQEWGGENVKDIFATDENGNLIRDKKTYSPVIDPQYAAIFDISNQIKGYFKPKNDETEYLNQDFSIIDNHLTNAVDEQAIEELNTLKQNYADVNQNIKENFGKDSDFVKQELQNKVLQAPKNYNFNYRAAGMSNLDKELGDYIADGAFLSNKPEDVSKREKIIERYNKGTGLNFKSIDQIAEHMQETNALKARSDIYDEYEKNAKYKTEDQEILKDLNPNNQNYRLAEEIEKYIQPEFKRPSGSNSLAYKKTMKAINENFYKSLGTLNKQSVKNSYIPEQQLNSAVRMKKDGNWFTRLFDRGDAPITTEQASENLRQRGIQGGSFVDKNISDALKTHQNSIANLQTLNRRFDYENEGYLRDIEGSREKLRKEIEGYDDILKRPGLSDEVKIQASKNRYDAQNQEIDLFNMQKQSRGHKIILDFIQKLNPTTANKLLSSKNEAQRRELINGLTRSDFKERYTTEQLNKTKTDFKINLKDLGHGEKTFENMENMFSFNNHNKNSPLLLDPSEFQKISVDKLGDNNRNRAKYSDMPGLGADNIYSYAGPKSSLGNKAYYNQDAVIQTTPEDFLIDSDTQTYVPEKKLGRSGTSYLEMINNVEKQDRDIQSDAASVTTASMQTSPLVQETEMQTNNPQYLNSEMQANPTVNETSMQANPLVTNSEIQTNNPQYSNSEIQTNNPQYANSSMQANPLVNETSMQANPLVNEAEIQTSPSLKTSSIQTNPLVSTSSMQTSTQTKPLVRETSMQANPIKENPLKNFTRSNSKYQTMVNNIDQQEKVIQTTPQVKNTAMQSVDPLEKLSKNKTKYLEMINNVEKQDKDIQLEVPIIAATEMQTNNPEFIDLDAQIKETQDNIVRIEKQTKDMQKEHLETMRKLKQRLNPELNPQLVLNSENTQKKSPKFSFNFNNLIQPEEQRATADINMLQNELNSDKYRTEVKTEGDFKTTEFNPTEISQSFIQSQPMAKPEISTQNQIMESQQKVVAKKLAEQLNSSEFANKQLSSAEPADINNGNIDSNINKPTIPKFEIKNQKDVKTLKDAFDRMFNQFDIGHSHRNFLNTISRNERDKLEKPLAEMKKLHSEINGLAKHKIVPGGEQYFKNQFDKIGNSFNNISKNFFEIMDRKTEVLKDAGHRFADSDKNATMKFLNELIKKPKITNQTQKSAESPIIQKPKSVSRPQSGRANVVNQNLKKKTIMKKKNH